MEALISFWLGIPHPELLSDEQFGAKFQQAEWLRRNPAARGVTLARFLQ